MGFRCGADEDAGDGIVFDNVFEVMGKGGCREEGGQIVLPVRAFCTDVFQGNVEVAEDRIEGGHAMDAKADEGILFLRMEEGGMEVSFLAKPIVSLQERVEHAGRCLSGQVP